MAHHLGVSGSTIFSDATLFETLFWEGTDHVEIGEFRNEGDFEQFIKMQKVKGVTFGLHSPLLRSGSKYDLIEPIYCSCGSAWQQVAEEAGRMVALGASYMLVHFPFFAKETTTDTVRLIEEGLQKLKGIQDAYGLPIVCEPKLGAGMNGAGIRYLNDFPVDTWKKYGIGICIDIGDYLIAAQDQVMDYIQRWESMIRVVHLHNVHHCGEKYKWIPVHPQYENSGYYRVEPILRYLVGLKDIYFVFEHTPDTNPDSAVIEEGFQWVRELVGWSR